ncbi:ribonuclease R [Sphingorhabdus lutea]|uniref:ribonuclease R n=1 Tax=Sphingorhabdus lutea TaxID=1913578 RepID=UPI0009F8B879
MLLKAFILREHIDLTDSKKPKSGADHEGLPTAKQIIKFIEEYDGNAGKREIAREFGLKGQRKILLKALLKDMTDDGLINMAPGRAFHKMGGLPKVTVLKIVAIEGNAPIAIPEKWEAEGKPAPQLRVQERGKSMRLRVGDRILARTEERGQGWFAFAIKKLAEADQMIMGMVQILPNGRQYLQPVDKRNRNNFAISGGVEAKDGQLVLAELKGRSHHKKAHIEQILGDPFEGASLSMIAVNKFGIPHHFNGRTEKEAEKISKSSFGKRTDLRHIPFVAIDPRDARDFDDAIWAAPSTSPDNIGGFDAIVAIADVSFYVRPGNELDIEARKRGNSVYFPDMVVPMLPHILSSGMCSLKQGENRAAMACHLVVDKNGKVTSWRFERALIKLSANIPYEDAQAAIDGVKPHEMTETALRPLWDCWALLSKARARREPLAIDMPERQVKINEQGEIVDISVRERLDAHMLVEDFMIAANVAAAKALETKKASVVYRVHEEPSREKIIALKEFLASLEIPLALGQVIKPSLFNNMLAKVDDDLIKPQIMEAVLRSQMQAYYGPKNMGHFGLSLGSYAHFTSPIRRYADLLVHRSLVDAYGLFTNEDGSNDGTGLAPSDKNALDKICEKISVFERRAMEAERETIDRYVAAYMVNFVDKVVETRITSVKNFGFFATVKDIGGDGIVPISSLGSEYFHYDEAEQALYGEKSRTVYKVGQIINLRVMEANVATGGIKFGILHEDYSNEEGGNSRNNKSSKPKMAGKYKAGARGRPANIRHKGRRRK